MNINHWIIEDLCFTQEPYIKNTEGELWRNVRCNLRFKGDYIFFEADQSISYKKGRRDPSNRYNLDHRIFKSLHNLYLKFPFLYDDIKTLQYFPDADDIGNGEFCIVTEGGDTDIISYSRVEKHFLPLLSKHVSILLKMAEENIGQQVSDLSKREKILNGSLAELGN